MIKISGLKQPGLGAASKAIPLQFEQLLKEFGEISNCFPGTINVQLEKELIILRPDKRTPPLNWINDFEEVFDLLRIKLVVPRLKVECDAWIYIAHMSPHRGKNNFHEIICEKIENLSDSERVEILIDRDYIVLPYNEDVIYVV